MSRNSLRIRLLGIQAVTIVIALGLTGWGLTYLFERHVARRIGVELDTYIAQIAARVTFETDGRPVLADGLADPRFDRIYGGLYWQIDNETAKISTRSRSLWDTRLGLPVDQPRFGAVHVHVAPGPKDSRLLVHERRLRFATPSGEQVARLIVAIDLADLSKISSEFAIDVTVALVVLGFILLVMGWIQVAIGLHPLSLVQRSVAAVRNGNTSRIEDDLPREVAPLVDEVNNLLAAQEAALTKARNRANDLAHGFKTPLTALNSDIRRLHERGQSEIAADIEKVAVAMRRQIERELATSRISEIRNRTAVKIAPIIEGIAETLRRTPDGEHKQMQIGCDPMLKARIDKDDLAEVLGNLMENAVCHGGDLVRIEARKNGERVCVEIADNGKGISPEERERALKRGERLDRSASGSGLGLAIVTDVLEAYGAPLELAASELGGLSARFCLPGGFSAQN